MRAGNLFSRPPDLDKAALAVCIIDHIPNLQTLKLKARLSITLHMDVLRAIESHPHLSKVIIEPALRFSDPTTQRTLFEAAQNFPLTLPSSKVIIFRQAFYNTTRRELESLQYLCGLGLQFRLLELTEPKGGSRFPDWCQLTIPGLESLCLEYPSKHKDSSLPGLLSGFFDRHPNLLHITFSEFPPIAQIEGTLWSSCTALATLAHCCELSGWTIFRAEFSRKLGDGNCGFSCKALTIISDGSKASKKSDFSQLSEACPVLESLWFQFKHPRNAWVLNDHAVSGD